MQPPPPQSLVYDNPITDYVPAVLVNLKYMSFCSIAWWIFLICRIIFMQLLLMPEEKSSTTNSTFYTVLLLLLLCPSSSSSSFLLSMYKYIHYHAHALLTCLINNILRTFEAFHIKACTCFKYPLMLLLFCDKNCFQKYMPQIRASLTTYIP